ncbi:MAG: hypothetical protein JXD22_04735 [Sedimentisphaerales bacterium]|nr:hypothetical protein [Sedimentisphaerales bacterium]
MNCRNDLSYSIVLLLLTLAGAGPAEGFPPPSVEPMSIVEAGSPATAIVIPDSSFLVVQYAADELRDYIEKATGAVLGIYTESNKPTGYEGLIYVGPCLAATAVEIDTSTLVPNGFIIRRSGTDFFLAGRDEADNELYESTDAGTLFAVYEFLDVHLQIRWLWPGDTGEVVPQYADIEVGNWEQVYEPQLIHSRLRTYGLSIVGTEGWASTAAHDNFVTAQRKWLRHHQLGCGTNMDYGHGFSAWYDKYHSTHPEYFNLLPDGTREADPYYANGAVSLISMNVSNAGFHSQVIDDWEMQRTITAGSGAQGDGCEFMIGFGGGQSPGPGAATMYFLKIYSDPEGTADILEETYGSGGSQVSFKNTYTWQFGGVPTESLFDGYANLNGGGTVNYGTRPDGTIGMPSDGNWRIDVKMRLPYKMGATFYLADNQSPRWGSIILINHLYNETSAHPDTVCDYNQRIVNGGDIAPAGFDGSVAHTYSFRSKAGQVSMRVDDVLIGEMDKPWINGVENDTGGKCTDPASLAMDVEPSNFESDYGFSWQDRLTQATNAFNQADENWYFNLGPMGDRYAKFWLALQQEADSRGYSDATIKGLAYANYNTAPIQTQLNDRIFVGLVPSWENWSYYFPWSAVKRQAFRDQWDGWHETGARMGLRPNYLLCGHNLPIHYAEGLGEDFCYAYKRGMTATDFDSLTGQYATQGPSLYMAARVHVMAGRDDSDLQMDINGDHQVDIDDFVAFSRHWLATDCDGPQWCGYADADNDTEVDIKDFAAFGAEWLKGSNVVEQILDEYYEAFGPAEGQVRAYFDLWKEVSESVPMDTDWNSMLVAGADEYFTPEIMVQARALMTAAEQAALGDSDAEAKVSYLEKGLTHVELTIAAQAAWENYQVTGDLPAWNTAIDTLDSFRALVENDLISNMAWLYYMENRDWVRDIVSETVSAGEITALHGDKLGKGISGGFDYFALDNSNGDNNIHILLDLGSEQNVSQIKYTNRMDVATMYNANMVSIRVAPDESDPLFAPYSRFSYTESVFNGSITPSTVNAGAARYANISDRSRRYFLLDFTSNFWGPIDDGVNTSMIVLADLDIIAP